MFCLLFKNSQLSYKNSQKCGTYNVYRQQPKLEIVLFSGKSRLIRILCEFSQECCFVARPIIDFRIKNLDSLTTIHKIELVVEVLEEGRFAFYSGSSLTGSDRVSSTSE